VEVVILHVQKYEKKVTRKFKSGGLHERHVVATWKLGNHLRIMVKSKSKSKGLPRQADVAQGVPGRLRPRISWRFGTTMVVGRQPNALAALTPGEIPGTHFQRLSRPQGTRFCRGCHGKNPQW